MLPNAFIGKAKKPTAGELAEALGSAHAVWGQLLTQLADDLEVNIHQWNSYSPKAGWSLKVKQGDRTILYMSPCSGSFRVSFALGDKAVKAALQSDLPRGMLRIIKEAKRYAEGTAVRIEVRAVSDLDAILKLANFKVAN
jgi:hypothetical protein